MVIKVDRKGNAKLLKWVAEGILHDISGRRYQKENFREYRKLDIGPDIGLIRYYRRECLNTQSEHMKFDGYYYDSRIDPPQIAMCCNCCHASWLLSKEEIQQARKELSRDVNHEF